MSTPMDLINDATRLSPARDYRVARGAMGSAYLTLFSPPVNDVVVTVAERPAMFPDDTHALSDLGLPLRMKDCLVYYACWQLLSQRLVVGLDDLLLTTRQTEETVTERTEILAGAQLQTQTEDKEGSETGTKDSVVAEARTGTTTEDIDTEGTENKVGSGTSSGGDVTTDVRTSQVTGGQTETTIKTEYENVLEEKDSLETTVPDLQTIEGGTEKFNPANTTKTTAVSNNMEMKTIVETGKQSQTMEWEAGDPPRQRGQITDPFVVTTREKNETPTAWDRTVETTNEHDETKTFGKTESQVGSNLVTVDEDDATHRTTEGAQTVELDKNETTSENSQATVSKNTTEGSHEDVISAQVQEKVTTEGTTTTTTGDEDTVVTTTEDNTITVNQSTDNTTTTTDTVTKTGGIETMGTYRDRMQAAQYYKLLLDMEVQSKKMRSWVARGL